MLLIRRLALLLSAAHQSRLHLCICIKSSTVAGLMHTIMSLMIAEQFEVKQLQNWALRDRYAA